VPTLGELIPSSVRARFPDSTLTPKALKVLSLPAPGKLSPTDLSRISAALTAALPSYTLAAREQRVRSKPVMRTSESPEDARGVAVAPPGNAGRPAIQNPDGSFSTERTITVGVDGRFLNIPTIVDGRQRTPSEAISLYRAGQNPAVDSAFTEADALTLATARSAQIGASRSQDARTAIASPSGATTPPQPPQTAAEYETAHYTALPPFQRALLQFSAGAHAALPSRETKTVEKFPGPQGPLESMARTSGGVAGFSAVAIPAAEVTAMTLGAAPLVAGAVGAGIAGGAAAGTQKERIARAGTMAVSSAVLGRFTNAVTATLAKRLATDAPEVAAALGKEFNDSVARAVRRGAPQADAEAAAQKVLWRKMADATLSAKAKVAAIQSGASAVGGAAVFGAGQPLAEHAVLGAMGEKTRYPSTDQMVQSGLELLAMNLITQGHGLARGFAAEGVRVGEPSPLDFRPTATETDAIKQNIKRPTALVPHMAKVSNEASTELANAIANMQKTATAPIGIKTPDLSIANVHIVPTLVRVFPGDTNPVRVTVLDNTTGKMHSIGLPSIAALRGALVLGPRPLPPGLEVPAAAEVPGPKPTQSKTTVPGPMVTPELHPAPAYAAFGEKAAARKQAILEVGTLAAQLTAKAQERIATAPKAIAALERQIAERPNDANVNRWKRRLEKLKALPVPEAPLEKAAVAEQPRKGPVAGGIASKEAAPPPKPKPGRGEQPPPKAKPSLPPTGEAPRPVPTVGGGGSKVVREPTAKERATMKSGETKVIGGQIVHRITEETERRLARTERRTAGATSLEGGEPIVERRKAESPARRAADRQKLLAIQREAESELGRTKAEKGPIAEERRREIEARARGAREAAAGAEPPITKTTRKPTGPLERGDRVSAVRGSYKGENGFVLSTGAGGHYIRWDTGRSSVESPENLRPRAGSARATEAEVKRLESVEEPTIPRSYAKGQEPPQRPDVEGEVAASVRKRAGLLPVEEMPYKPTRGFVSTQAMATKDYLTDGHMLLVASETEAKIHERLARLAIESARPSPKAEGFKQVIDEATAKPSVQLQARGWATVVGGKYMNTTGEHPVAVFYDPKTDRVVTVDPDKWKLAVKAVSPDSYEQRLNPKAVPSFKGNKEANLAQWAPLAMYRGGKFVGLIMPIRETDAGVAEIRGLLGKSAELVTHESRMGGAPSAGRQAPAPGRGIPIASRAPRIPTEAESRALPEATVPALPPEMRKGVLAGTVEKAREVLHEFVAITNPVRYAVGPNLDVLMKAKGSIKRALFRTEQAQKAMHRYWEGRPKAQVMDFWDRLESGKQPAPHLAEIDALYRERAENMFKAISRYKEIPYWENWFPHLWKDQKKAREFFASRRPMEGRKSFLKKRLFEDIRSGIEAGLEPASWNPEEIMQAAEHNARKYVMVQEMVEDFKALGSMKLVRLGEKPPEGFRPLNQNWAQLYLNPEIQLKEYHDKKIMEGLAGVADAIGIRRERKVRIGGTRLGYSESRAGSTGRVVTKFATPESVLAHEIGHQIDSKYGLRNEFIRKSTPAEKKELRALVDLRLGGEETTPAFKRYIREGPEKMATLLEALIHAPEEFRRVAPTNYGKFVAFLSARPELAPLVHIRPSLQVIEGTGTVHAGGVVLGGKYWAEENLARLLDNHMSRDFITETRLGRGIMDSRNTLNAINLGVSAFHATGTTLLAMMSRMGVGISDIAHGEVRLGTYKVLTSPAASIAYAREGWKFFRGAPELAHIEEALFTGGASLERKQYYKNQMLDAFVKNARQAVALGTPYERLGGAAKAVALAPFAAIEAPMRLLSTKYIPQMKVGAFRDLFSSQLRIKAKDIAAGKTSEADVARIAWRDVEDRFGLINYDNEFWNSTLKTSVMVLIRAPGWTLGTIRGLGGAAFADLPRFAARAARGKAPEWTSRMSFALSMVFSTMAVGAVYQFLHTGKWPNTLEDYLHPQNGLTDERGRSQRVNLPTYMKDVEGWSTDPVKTSFGRIQHGRGASTIGHGGKLAPEITLTLDLLENQSYRGPIRNVNDPAYEQAGQVMRYIFAREQPFAVQQARRIAREGGGKAKIAESFFGITPYYPRSGKPRPFRYHEQGE